ncbi:hypothetical protein CDCA_CDCA03G0957 [Cyanidium caldarium]|uniref:Large ribosomal subunit protein uL30m n=1 Tax=Cyanidium caldarium TaxID=2771 RepID=A0AAV9IRK4_CYACA|nr:hypothetical protein CDCA_CDCA03G0957 [Cyanidium caldarium]|eukprot:ctg_949.g221
MDAATRLVITLRRSFAGVPKKQRLTLQALGLKRVHHTVHRPDSRSVWGALRRILHLVEIERVPESVADRRCREKDGIAPSAYGRTIAYIRSRGLPGIASDATPR